MTMRAVSLYLHIPFCKRRCPYCTFYHVPHAEDFESSFVRALTREIRDSYSSLGGAAYCPTVFFGGGTPSVLGRDSLDEIFATIAPLLPSDTSAEITFEVNPEDVDALMLDDLQERGVNRVSIGVQSMDPGAQGVLKRCRPATNEKAITRVRERFDNFSVDVLLGTPGGTVEGLARTLESLCRHEPPHFSVYCLEPGGVMQREIGDFFDRVDVERSADEYMHACGELCSRGYVHYEVSNFARPGYESRHNRVYWRGEEYIGVGPGAHSLVDGERFHNEPSIQAYVASAGDPIGLRRADRRGVDERHLEALMLALRTSDGLTVHRFPSLAAVVDDLVANDLARRVNGRVVLTDRGFLLLNEIVMRLSQVA